MLNGLIKHKVFGYKEICDGTHVRPNNTPRIPYSRAVEQLLPYFCFGAGIRCLAHSSRLNKQCKMSNSRDVQCQLQQYSFIALNSWFPQQGTAIRLNKS